MERVVLNRKLHLKHQLVNNLRETLIAAITLESMGNIQAIYSNETTLSTNNARSVRKKISFAKKVQKCNGSALAFVRRYHTPRIFFLCPIRVTIKLRETRIPNATDIYTR